jgi:hypothetical protein
MHASAIDQSFPCGDEDQRNGRGVTHGTRWASTAACMVCVVVMAGLPPVAKT